MTTRKYKTNKKDTMQLQKGEKEQNKDTNDHQNPTQQQMYSK